MNDIRLSLCVITKNEENNIEKVLDCVKSIAFERIVVDTGSTDRTIERIKRAGAQVFNFEWIYDFSAAKNFAIEKATGDWILSLDADEYYSYEDARRLIEFLGQIDREQETKERINAVSCMLVNVDDNGRPMTKSTAVRVFRNIPEIRFKGAVHEQITVEKSNILHNDEFMIIHTGYSESAHKKTGKAQRNIALLRTELTKKPHDLTIKAYLANSLSMSESKENRDEAESLFNEIMSNSNGAAVNNFLRIKMYIYLINKYINETVDMQKSEEICRKALKEFPWSVDFEYLLATILQKKNMYNEAWEHLKSCEANLLSHPNPDDSIMIPADPTILFSQMIIMAKNMGDIENVVLYSTHVLTLDKTRKSVLGPCIATLIYYKVSESEITGLLSNIYDMNDPGDLLFIANTAREHGAIGFANHIKNMRR